MKIIVCLGNVPDTTTKVRFADNHSKFDVTGVQWVINPWDELALTRAMELKEDASNNVDSVTVVTVGLVSSEPTIRKALAIGADDAVRIDAEPTDSYAVAYQIAEYLKGVQDEFNCSHAGLGIPRPARRYHLGNGPGLQQPSDTH